MDTASVSSRQQTTGGPLWEHGADTEVRRRRGTNLKICPGREDRSGFPWRWRWSPVHGGLWLGTQRRANLEVYPTDAAQTFPKGDAYSSPGLAPPVPTPGEPAHKSPNPEGIA
jgi:hypothetical protein